MPRCKHVDIPNVLQTFLGFDAWFITKHSVAENAITYVTIGRWHGHKLLEMTFKIY